jgi:hypothetical protein
MERPSPSASATGYNVGTIKTGNDGNKWIITKTSNNVKRWKRLSYGKSVKKRTSKKKSARKRTSKKKSARKRTSKKKSARKRTSKKKSAIKRTSKKKSSIKRKSFSKKYPFANTKMAQNREDLINQIRRMARYWEKMTTYNQDLPRSRLNNEPMEKLKKFFRSYKSKKMIENWYDWQMKKQR